MSVLPFALAGLLLTAGCGGKDKEGGQSGPPGSSTQVQADAQKRAADQAKMYQQGQGRPPGAPAGAPMPSGPPR